MRVRKAAAALAATVALVAGGIIGGTGQAQAATAPCGGIGEPIDGRPGLTWNGCVYATDGLYFRWHTAGGTVSWNDPLTIALPYRTKVWIYCTLPGPAVTGNYGPTTVWDAVGYYQRPGGPVEWFASYDHSVTTDAWIYTGTSQPVGTTCN
ncbi:hypothetical protein ACFYS8_17040 [Kitasatospora sp. NPDC004615]|uniref:hypothetical protein n=1 Tax=Kitasatospora sp. NPDC004615 TaxID=3364017 RepID=UPI0036CD823F